MQEPELDEAPAEVRRLLRACLEKDPKKRLRDIGDVWRLLEEPAILTERLYSSRIVRVPITSINGLHIGSRW